MLPRVLLTEPALTKTANNVHSYCIINLYLMLSFFIDYKEDKLLGLLKCPLLLYFILDVLFLKGLYRKCVITIAKMSTYSIVYLMLCFCNNYKEDMLLEFL